MRGLPVASTVRLSRGLPAASDNEMSAALSCVLPTKRRRGAGGAAALIAAIAFFCSTGSSIFRAAFSFSTNSLSRVSGRSQTWNPAYLRPSFSV
jgi:hypothetical protein